MDAEQAYEALGAISALRGDSTLMREYHLAAIRLNPNSFRTHLNFSVSLSRMGCFVEAADEARIAFERNSATPGVVRHYLKLLMQAGLFEQAHEVSRRLEMLAPGEDTADRAFVLRMLKMMKEREIGEQALAALMSCASRAVAEMDVQLWEVRTRFLADEHSETLLCEVIVNATPGMIRRLNDRFIELTVDSEVDPFAFSIFCPRFSALECMDADTTAATA